jgi:hypothetical protein
MNGVTTAADQDALYDLTVDVATGHERESANIAVRLAGLFHLDMP